MTNRQPGDLAPPSEPERREAVHHAEVALRSIGQWAFIGKQGSAGLTLPGSGISTATAMRWEAVLTAGLLSVILMSMRPGRAWESGAARGLLRRKAGRGSP